MVGDGPYRNELEAEVQKYNLQGRVVFAGMAAPSQVEDYYRAGDVFVSVSQSETQGLTYLEAMVSGLPLLCRKDDCLDGVLHPAENDFFYQNAEAFSSALQRLSPAARIQMGTAGKALVQTQFTETGFAQSVLQVYLRCLRVMVKGFAA